MKTRIDRSYLPSFFSLLFVVGIGVYASVRASALNETFPFSCFPGEAACLSWSLEATLFYLVVIGILTPIVLVQMKSQARRQGDTEALLAETRALIDTAPPRHLLRFVNIRYTSARDTVAQLRRSNVIEDQNLAYAIRVILRGMVDVAHYWDTHAEEGTAHVYRATVMLIYPAGEYAAPEQRQLLLREIRFADRNALAPAQGWQHFDLYLRTATVLSTSNRIDPEQWDDSVGPLILGVKAPVHPSVKPEQMVVGAPYSLFHGRTQYIADTARIAQSMTSDPYFEGLKSEIEKYYRNERHARSIMSIPLPAQRRINTWEAENCPYMGVVNIFRDSPHMLGGKREASEQYSDLMTPLCDMLAELIDQSMEAGIDFDFRNW